MSDNFQKCEIHGIFKDAEGKCEFCENEKNPNRRKEIQIVGGGEKKGVNIMSKEGKRGV